jgi:hypothetical protein
MHLSFVFQPKNCFHPDYSRCEGVKIEKACLIGALSKFVVSTVHQRCAFVNLQKLSPLQENCLKHQTRRLSSLVIPVPFFRPERSQLVKQIKPVFDFFLGCRF